MCWLKGTGKIIYDPFRPGLKKKTQWWCVVLVDREITRYYRWGIQRALHVKQLCQPSWNAHVSVIRGEKPSDNLLHLWKKYDKEIVEFEYRHYPRVSGDTTNDRPNRFWFVEVRCPKLKMIRDELGRPSNWNFHLTVGRIWY